MTDVTERGLEVFGEIMGEERARQMRLGIESEGFGSAIAKLATDFAFGSVWGRDGLERKQRSLVVIGILIAQRQTAELKNHIRIGLTNGLTPREIEEALIQTLPYVGFPAVASATTAIVEVLREAGVDTQTRTAEERGML
ncbi:carboxymuconolactone decarboxylase [Rhizobium sp. CRIBSB]|nr:carboxymuconolactone decarboxylase [Rhizobium sp. CRIBSB]